MKIIELAKVTCPSMCNDTNRMDLSGFTSFSIAFHNPACCGKDHLQFSSEEHQPAWIARSKWQVFEHSVQSVDKEHVLKCLWCWYRKVCNAGEEAYDLLRAVECLLSAIVKCAKCQLKAYVGLRF